MTIKAIFPKISKVISDIINLSFFTGTVNAKLKISRVTPIFKNVAN